MDSNKFLRRPQVLPVIQPGRFEKYALSENPFPASPVINPDSIDARSNGNIYDESIRDNEQRKLIDNFLSVAQSDPNHLRLGYIIDDSYIGRGNGKSAFLLHQQRTINEDYCYLVSNGQNRCFALTLSPEPSGRTKTFESFVDLLVKTTFRSGILLDALSSIRLKAITDVYPDFNPSEHFTDEADFHSKIVDPHWYKANDINVLSLNKHICSNDFIKEIPPEIDLFNPKSIRHLTLPSQEYIESYYAGLKRLKEKLDFAFSHLVALFVGAGFNGAYVFVDDFERIPDFQSDRQKRDFAIELRTCQYDGINLNAKIGFYNIVLVLHAGVRALMQKAWDESGLEQRSPVYFKAGTPTHIVRFEKLTPDKASTLIQSYLQNYRIASTQDPLFPFTRDAIARIADLSELNAARILRMAYELLDRASQQQADVITSDFVTQNDPNATLMDQELRGIHDAETKDLNEEAK